jgi:adenylate kinase family enzyme
MNVKNGILSIKSMEVEGKGAIILTGPSGCGKGEVAKYLAKIFSIDNKYHLSMGEILRNLINRALSEESFLKKLETKYNISNKVSIFDTKYNSENIVVKATQYKEELDYIIKNDPNLKNIKEVTQFVWLYYSVNNGLLVPKEWTNNILEATFKENEKLRNALFLLDGYPRTIEASKHMLNLFDRLDIPIVKIVHLSITKSEMLRRASLRNRHDDNIKALDNRFLFYIEQVQPSVDEMKKILGSDSVVLIDAHQPVFNNDDTMNVSKSIEKVAQSVLKSINLTF